MPEREKLELPCAATPRWTNFIVAKAVNKVLSFYAVLFFLSHIIQAHTFPHSATLKSASIFSLT